jgi:hypothetical protein
LHLDGDASVESDVVFLALFYGVEVLDNYLMLGAGFAVFEVDFCFVEDVAEDSDLTEEH